MFNSFTQIYIRKAAESERQKHLGGSILELRAFLLHEEYPSTKSERE